MEAKLSLTEDSYKFDFELLCSSRGETVPFPTVVEALFRNRNYVKLADGEFVRLEAATLLSLLKAVGQTQAKSRPLLLVLHDGIRHRTTEWQAVESRLTRAVKQKIRP